MTVKKRGCMTASNMPDMQMTYNKKNRVYRLWLIHPVICVC